MKAISTKYKGPTNSRGARIIADDGDGNKVTIPYPYELDTADAHQEAAEKLKKKMGWNGKLACGSTKTGYCCVFVSAARRRRKRK
jgi:hypothetical protein